MHSGARWDVIIVGTGAGGGALAWRLAPSGKRILLLERGGFLARERDNWDSTAVFIRAKYRARETWFDGRGNAFHQGIRDYVGATPSLTALSSSLCARPTSVNSVTTAA